MQLVRSQASRNRLVRLALRAIAVVPVLCLALPAAAQTLDRVRQSGRIKLGYVADMRPFSYRNEAGTAAGYSVALCERIAAQVGAAAGRPNLTAEWVPVTSDARLRAVAQGDVDLLCSPTSMTLGRRGEVSFSIPVVAGGNRAVMHRDALADLRRALGDETTMRPVWRGSPAAKYLGNARFAVVSGTTTERWLESERKSLGIDARITPVVDYRTALQQLLNRDVDVLFGERTLVLSAMNPEERENLVVLDRLFTHESGGLALARGDEDFRLLVDRALSRIYATGEFSDLYREWFGEFDAAARTFFLSNTLAE
jgi:polar amino acid transport system substrate-binding protein